MKKGKAILACLLTLSLFIALFAACGEQSNSEAAGNDAQTNVSSNKNTSPAPAETDEEEEMENIVFWFFDGSSKGGDHGQKIEDAVNAISEPEINVHVDIVFADSGGYRTQFGVSLSSGETIDLACFTPVPAISSATMFANGQAMEISGLLETYAPQALELVEDYIAALTYDGGIYGIPTFKNWVTNNYIMMRKDILEELDLLEYAENMTSWSEYEYIMETVYTAYNGELVPVTNANENYVLKMEGYWNATSDSFDGYEVFDDLGDSLSVLACVDDKVENYYADPRSIADFEMVKRWYDNGWVYSEASFTTEQANTFIKNGVSFSKLDGSEIGCDARQEMNTGYAMVCVMTAPGMITTSNVSSWGTVIPITAEAPEAAAKFINLMYTNADVVNTLAYGIYGQDWIYNDEGFAAYPEGVDSKTVEYHENDWFCGNQFLVAAWEGSPEGFRALSLEDNQSAAISPYLGFTLNTGSLDTIIANLSAVIDQYDGSLKCGLYTEELYAEFMTKLKAAGIDEYVAEAQKQLDAWLSAK